MKTNKFSIETPCSEDWNAMHPTNNNERFCDSCQKTVVDFSNMTDAEVLAFFEHHKGQKICGRMRKGQLNRPMQAAFIEQRSAEPVTFRRSPIWKTALVGMALTGWLAGCTPSMANTQEPIPTAIEWVEFLLNGRGSLSGRVLMNDNQTPIEGASVSLYSGDVMIATVSTNQKGYFEFKKLDLGKYKAELRLYASANGFSTQERLLDANNKNQSIEFVMNEEIMMQGGIGAWED